MLLLSFSIGILRVIDCITPYSTWRLHCCWIRECLQRLMQEWYISVNLHGVSVSVVERGLKRANDKFFSFCLEFIHNKIIKLQRKDSAVYLFLQRYAVLLNHANIFCSFSWFISKNKQKRSKPLAFSQKMLTFAPNTTQLSTGFSPF